MSPQNALYQKHIHLVGIGGTGMSAIAQVLLERGCTISGSDQVESPGVEQLRNRGATVHIGHSASWIAGADIVAISSAIRDDNPEVVAARQQGIPVLKRSEFIGELLAGHYSIAVAGTHGKTTTTAMIAFILSEAGLSPSFIIGGVSRNLDTNARSGNGPHFVIEADEYDRMFLGLNPNLAIVTNLEMDHPDCYGCIEELTEAFTAFLRRVPPSGYIIVNGDERRIREMLRQLELRDQKLETFGFAPDADWRPTNIEPNEVGGNTFSVWHERTLLGPFELQVPGIHNVLNALAAIAATTEVGASTSSMQDSLSRFEGTARRFEHKGTESGVIVIDDYAHHPTEIRATLAAAHARYAGSRIWAVFQPHTYSRFKALLPEFVRSFGLADHVIVTDIFASRERNSSGVSARSIIDLMNHPDARHIQDFHEVVTYLVAHVQPGDVCITLGAGDCYLIGEELLDTLRANPITAN